MNHYGSISVNTIRAQEQKGFAEREFIISNKNEPTRGGERRVTQMHYIDWPDHGTPEDSTEFCRFIQRVRELRATKQGNLRPMVVHCSAGIGRTGVLILMETALCLMERQLPVFPVQLVQRMRQQRAMMIQTTGQFAFVCEAILRSYKGEEEITVRQNDQMTVSSFPVESNSNS